MKRNLVLIICLWLISACDFKPGGGRNNETPDKILQLRLEPVVGASYDYRISNETKTEFDADNKTIESTNKTDYVVNYSINKDSSGNFLVGIKYKKIHIYQKKNDEESDLDADNTDESSDPVERMLAALKDARITATINSSGEVIKVSGYQQIPDQFLSQLNNIDPNARMAAQKQWQQLIENNLVKKNIDRLFKMFPDSAVHIGEKWKMTYKQAGDINFAVKDFFTLKSVEDGKAIVESSGRISTDSSASAIMGYQVNSNLKGTQKGEYEIAIGSGMMENCKVTSAIEGTLNVMGREIPVSINIEIKIKGSQIR